MGASKRKATSDEIFDMAGNTAAVATLPASVLRQPTQRIGRLLEFSA
jgi:hypothetical protein